MSVVFPPRRTELTTCGFCIERSTCLATLKVLGDDFKQVKCLNAGNG